MIVNVQVPIYMIGQYVGAFLAALVLWGVYADAITMVGSYATGRGGKGRSPPYQASYVL